jgi:hypothetical protein
MFGGEIQGEQRHLGQLLAQRLQQLHRLRENIFNSHSRDESHRDNFIDL